MSITTAASLVEQLRACRLLDADQLGQLAASPLPKDPRQLARHCVRRGWLTPFQVNRLFVDRAEGLLLDSYVLLEKLGEGGMGAVFKAKNWKLGKVVALKVIREDRLLSRQVAKRFLQEMRALARLDHPHIIHALDGGEANHTFYFVMEFVEGQSLEVLVREKGPLPPDLACEYVRQAALGLQHAHERGLVHRDVKPSNLMLAAGGVIKILDLGLARLSEAEGETPGRLTGSGMLMGTPDYIAPEQARDAHYADARSDLYSLGCTLYFLLAGEVPFPGGTPTEKLFRQMGGTPRPLEQLRPDLSPGVLAVVRRLMAKAPADRFPSAAEVASTLYCLQASGELRSGGTNPWARLTEIDPEPPVPVRGRRPGRRLALGVAVVLVCVAGLVWLLGRLGSVPPEPSGAVVVEVQADRRWQDTGVDVAEGEPVTLTPEGLWRRGHRACTARGFDKEPRDRAAWPEAPLMCLLARVDDEEEPTPVPGKLALVPHRSGRLYLQANDLGLHNNRGHLKVTIDDGRRSELSLPSPPPLRAQAAQDAWERFGTRKMTRRDLAAVLDFKQRYAGTALATDAAESLGELFKTPGPLDRLDPAKVPAAERDAWRLAGREVPKELVAVLGESRLRHWGSVSALAYQPGGKLLASGGEDGVVRLWDTATLSERAVLRGHSGSVSALAFTADGHTLASAASDGRARLWTLTGTGAKEREVLTEPSGPARTVAFSPKGEWLAVGSDQTIRLWELGQTRSREVAVLRGHTAEVTTLAFSADGRTLASGGSDRTVRLWQVDANGAKQRGDPLEVGATVRAVRFSPGASDLVAAGDTTSIQSWQLAKDGVKPGVSLGVPSSWVYALAFSPDGRLLAAGGSDGRVRLWPWTGARAPAGRPVLSDPNDRVLALAYAPDGRSLASAGMCGTVRLWDPATAKERTVLRGHLGRVNAVAFAPDGTTLASGSDDRTVRLWQPAGGETQELAVLRGHTGAVSGLAFSPDGRTFASASNDRTVRLWRPTRDGALGLAVLQHPGILGVVAFSPDGRTLATAGEQGSLCLWARTGQGARKIAELRGHTGWVLGLAFSSRPGGNLLVSAGYTDFTIRLWEQVGEGARQGDVLRGHSSGVTAVAFSPDGTVLASAGVDGTVRLWRLRGGAWKEGLVLRGPVVPAQTVVFCPDGRTLASAGRDGMVRLWEVASGRPLRQWQLPGLVRGLAWSPDGRHLATANAEGTVYILRLTRPGRDAP